MDGASFVALPEQQFRDEEGAKQKEDRYSQIAQKTDVVKPVVLGWVDGHKVHSMDDKNHQEGNEAEYVQFGAIKAADGHLSARKPSLRFVRSNR